MDEPVPQLRLPERTWRDVSTAADQRVGELERNRVCDELSAAYAAGRLDHLELDERLAAAVSARTRLDLFRLVRDLTPLSSRRTVAVPRASGWSAADGLALALLVGAGVSIVVMLLMIGAVSSLYFFGAVVGGSLAFLTGVCATHLWQGSIRRAQGSTRTDG